MIYILKVHPRFWTVFANRRSFNEDSWNYQFPKLLFSLYLGKLLSRSAGETVSSYCQCVPETRRSIDHLVSSMVNSHMKEIRMGIPIPPPLPRFNQYTTNMAEGEALRAINNSSRLVDVFNAIQQFCFAVNDGLTKVKASMTRMTERNSEFRYTPIGYQVSSKQAKNSPEGVEVMEVVKQTEKYHVSALMKTSGGGTYNVEIKFHKGLDEEERFHHYCEKCSLSEMMDRPCVCVETCFQQAMQMKYLPNMLSSYRNKLLCHPAHLLESFQKTLPHLHSIVIPSQTSCLSALTTNNYICVNYDGSKSAWEGIVFPPPKYKAVSISSKRIQSLGEGGKSTAKSSQRNREGARTTKETETTATPTLSESLMDDMFSSRSSRRKLIF